MTKPTVVFAFDKFRHSATSRELGDSAAVAASEIGWQPVVVPVADGGEGTLDALGGPNKTTTVVGPLGQMVDAPWRLEGKVASIEMSAASGLVLAGGAEENDPLEASTVGTGQLIATAIELGARTVHVFLGGSATTDGGLGAIRALESTARIKEIDLVVGCDVETTFVDAASVFAPQKGASSAQVALLTRRLERLAQVYQEEFQVDVTAVRGGGAAGGLAGGLLAIGGRLQSGFDLVAETTELDLRLEQAQYCFTGEGRLDDQSFQGKVVGNVVTWCRDLEVPVSAVVGVADDGIAVPPELNVVSLVERHGLDAAMTGTAELVAAACAEVLADQPVPPRRQR